MPFAYRSLDGCDFMNVRIDLLCQLDYLTDVIKMTVGIWICVHLRASSGPGQLVGGQFSALSRKAFLGFKGRRLSTACASTLHHTSSCSGSWGSAFAG